MLIQVDELKKVYGSKDAQTTALNGVSFSIGEGEFVAVTGPSGCGKSTLMHILGFLERSTSGSYKFDGRVAGGFSGDEQADIRNTRIGFVFQAFNLLPRTTVWDNVKLPLSYTNYPVKKENKLISDALDWVNIGNRSRHYTNQLSGGEQQRVAIARALVNDPAIIFADEPTGNLDSKSGRQVMEIFYKLNDAGKTIVLVTHETYTAQMAKRIIQMLDGKIISDSPVKDRKVADGFIK
jgi:putative ABC transport system ATP-binding protein